MDRGRRIYYNKANGDIILNTGEASGDVVAFDAIAEIGYIDLQYGEQADNFARARRYHVDPNTKAVVFDKLVDAQPTYTELQQQLLQAQGVI